MNLIDICNIGGKSVQKYDGEKKYIATGDVIDNNIVSFELVNYYNKPSRANVVIEKNDVIFAKMKDTIKVLKADQNSANHIYSTGFCCLTPKSNVLQNYLYFYLNSSVFNVQKNKKCSGATQKALNNYGLKEIQIKDIPTLKEQQMIVKKLFRINDLITTKKEEIIKLKELIKSQFVEMFGDLKINEKGWIKCNMGNYLPILTDFSANGSYKTLDSQVKMYDELNYAYMVRTTDLENNNYVDNIKYIDEKAYNLLSKSKVYANDIIMCKIGSAGKCYLMPELNMPVSLGRNAFLFRFSEKINPIFIYNLLISDYGQSEINKYVRGAVTKTITKDDARKVQIVAPPIELQNKFANIVKQIDKQKFEFEKSLKKLEELQSSLMQEYFG